MSRFYLLIVLTFFTLLIINSGVVADNGRALDVHYRPHPHHTFQSRYRCHVDDPTTKKKNTKGRLAERDAALRNAWSKMSHLNYGSLSASSTTVKEEGGDHFADSGIRYDHAWNISVGWVDNVKSDSEVSAALASYILT